MASGLIALLLAAISSATVLADAKPRTSPTPSTADIEFFEARIRPILAEKCIFCHGEKRQRGGLRLDNAEGLRAGAGGAAIVVPGQPDASRLIEVIRHDGEIVMPPKEKLSDDAIASLAQWVAQGAIWPETPSNIANESQPHWAFQPVVWPTTPAVQNADWCQQEIDRFVLSALEARGMSPSPAADRATLARRTSFDLLGLPPSRSELDRFLNDLRSDAFERFVDRLLASPRYGERWGRHWLDVARYADTKGYLFTQDRRYPYAYTYRDYVVRSLNQDLPYDQFVKEQIAADLLPPGPEGQSLPALGYLTLGRRFLGNPHDIIDDRIDVVTRGMLGLTVTCARCHDHKYDPVPAADYYSLYGVFASCTEPDQPVHHGPPDRVQTYLAHQATLNQGQQDLTQLVDQRLRQLRTAARAQVEPLLRAGASVGWAEQSPTLAEAAKSAGVSPNVLSWFIRSWKAHLSKPDRNEDPVLGSWVRFAALPADAFASQASATVDSLRSGKTPVNELVKSQVLEPVPTSMNELIERYAKLFAMVEQEWRALSSQPTPPQAFPDKEREAIRQLLHGSGPFEIAAGDVEALVDEASQTELRTRRERLDQLRASSPPEPLKTMVLSEAKNPYEPRVFIRGNPGRPGDPVPRRFLSVLAGPNAAPFANGSGRLELAQAIASRDNPLTARVIVNRVWMHHFGQGLVRTPSDFGTRCDGPTHPQLLDHLAATLMNEGWSLKRLHRRIVLSSTYQQASHERSECQSVDPDNRLLWRYPRRRLDFEALHDAILDATQQLDLTMGGASAPLFGQHASHRRALYGYIDRQNLEPDYRTFDFANPDTTNPQRFVTTVPQQALFLMNSPFVLDQARCLVDLRRFVESKDPSKKLKILFEQVLRRAPEPRELELGLAFVGSDSKPETWQRLAQVLFLSNEFAFVD